MPDVFHSVFLNKDDDDDDDVCLCGGGGGEGREGGGRGGFELMVRSSASSASLDPSSDRITSFSMQVPKIHNTECSVSSRVTNQQKVTRNLLKSVYYTSI